MVVLAANMYDSSLLVTGSSATGQEGAATAGASGRATGDSGK